MMLNGQQIELTGYASIDKPWLKYYDKDADKIGYNIPANKTLWDLYRELLLEQKKIPAIEYFGKSISRQDFISNVEKWARSFKALGIKPDEIVVIYSVVLPEVCAIFFALNAIGAVPYFLKLDSSEEDLRNESKEAKTAIVFDGLWDKIKDSLEDRLDRIIMLSAKDDMPFLIKQFVSVSEKVKGNAFDYRKNAKCISAREVLESGEKWRGEYAEPFTPGRIAAITVSSGTTGTGVKGIMDTNESMIASVMATANAKIRYFKGRKLLLEMPLMASTSLNCLFLLPLYQGMTLIIDPRLSRENWYKHVMKYKPAVTICTGAFWEVFFRKAEEEIRNGKKVDFSFVDSFIMGGAGTTPEKLEWMSRVLKENGSETGIFSGYGLSEIFGVMSVEQHGAKRENTLMDCPVISVGLPIPGFVVSVHGENGEELKYGERGELWAFSPTMMHGYYGKPELTEKTVVDGVVHTGDLCSIDADGYIYCYGRIKNCVYIDGKRVFLFDIANKIRETLNLADCMVEKKEMEDGTIDIVAYVARHPNQYPDEEALLKEIDAFCRKDNINISGYKVYELELPANPATLKPRTNDLDGFVKYEGGNEYEISYEKCVGGLIRINKAKSSQSKQKSA